MQCCLSTARSGKVLLIALAFIMAVISAPAAEAQAQTRGAYTDSPEMPSTPMGRRAMEVIDALNTGDAGRIARLVEESFGGEFAELPMEQHERVFLDVFDRTRGVDFVGVRSYDARQPAGELVVILKSRLTDDWRAIVMSMEPDPPHRIIGLQFAPARPPSFVQPDAGPLTLDEAVQRLDAFVTRMAEADAFSGAVLLAKDGRVVYERAVGEANKAWKTPNRIDTKFNLGSMNKMFTAVAIAQLAERGALSYSDPISKHLGESWLPSDVAETITIEHLLTHTSGLGSYFNDEFMSASRARFREVDDYKPLIADDRPTFEPGSDWQYSNSGFMLLGAIVQAASGLDYFDYMREHVYGPAGMTNSDCYDLDRPVPNLAEGYIRERADGGIAYRNNLFMHVIRGGPAGGGYSTVRDLFTFAEALRNDRLISAASRDTLWSLKPSSPDYGYGFSIEELPTGRVVGHSGGFPGINSLLDIHVDGGWTCATMSNCGDAAAMTVGRRMNDLVARVK